MVTLPSSHVVHFSVDPPRISVHMFVVQPAASGSWGGQLATVHLSLGHVAAYGIAARPSRPVHWMSPVLAIAADMGV